MSGQECPCAVVMNTILHGKRQFMQALNDAGWEEVIRVIYRSLWHWYDRDGTGLWWGITREGLHDLPRA
eukprot:scaffold10230_cov22-Tisochrysis_lutea.AAC.3